MQPKITAITKDDPDGGGSRVFIDTVDADGEPNYAMIWPPEGDCDVYLVCARDTDYEVDPDELAEFIEEEFGVSESDLRAAMVRAGILTS